MRLSIFNAKKAMPLEFSNKKYNNKNEWCKNYSDDKQYFKSFGKRRVCVIIWPLIGNICVINFTC